MEEILKALQGKSMTKNNIFDFLAELDLTSLNEIKKTEVICEACMKPYVSEKALKRHYRKSLPCKKWINLPEKHNIQLDKGIQLIINDVLRTAISDVTLECKFCNTSFTNTGNLHKHFNTSHVCNRLAYHDFKTLFFKL